MPLDAESQKRDAAQLITGLFGPTVPAGAGQPRWIRNAAWGMGDFAQGVKAVACVSVRVDTALTAKVRSTAQESLSACLVASAELSVTLDIAGTSEVLE